MRAAERRKREIEQLMREGLPLHCVDLHRCRIGPLTIFLASGRWINEATGARGRLNRMPMRELVSRELRKALFWP